jgi:hypothetical protein
MNFSRFALLICNLVFNRQIDINRIELVALNPARPIKLSQRVLGFNMQHIFEFSSRITSLGIMYKSLGCIEQVAEPRKTHRTIIPQAQHVKPSNGPKRVVLAPMRIAAQVFHLFQFAENSGPSRIVHCRDELSQSGYFPAFKELLDDLWRVFCCIHNETISPY